jgi:hypothetical protein
MISLLFCLLLGVVLGSFLAYMIYFIFSIINGLFDCLGDNGSIIGWTIVIGGILLLFLL